MYFHSSLEENKYIFYFNLSTIYCLLRLQDSFQLDFASRKTNLNVPYSSSKFLATIAIFLTEISAAGAQKVCYGSKKEVPNNSGIFAESLSARKCMRVEALGIKPDSNVVLDECLYRTKMARDQKLIISTNSIGKTMIKTDGGRDQFYCLITLQSDILQTTLCNSNNLLQNWTLKPVKGQTGQFLIEQFSSKNCLKPKSRSRGSQIQLTSCNSYETEQIWKLYYSPPSNATAITPLLSC